MAAPFRQRVRLSVHGARAILPCRGTVPASIGRWLAAGPLQPTNHRGLRPGGARAAPLPVSGCRVYSGRPDSTRNRGHPCRSIAGLMAHQARVLALSLPIAAALYISSEAVNPGGTDQPITTRTTALKELPIAAHHPAQLFASGSLTLLALGALAVPHAAIAPLVRNRGWANGTIAALIGGTGAFCGALINVLVGYNLAAAATAHISPTRPRSSWSPPSTPAPTRCSLRSTSSASSLGRRSWGLPCGGARACRAGWRSCSSPTWNSPSSWDQSARSGSSCSHFPSGGNGPAGRPDLAGSGAADQPQPGARRRACEQPVKMSRHSPAVSQALRILESVKARA
jgi:hypothetical protein